MIDKDKITACLSRCSKIKVVSFDIFDTVLDRTIPSSLVSRIASNGLVQHLALDVAPDEIYRHRQHSQKASKKEGMEWRLIDWLKIFAAEQKLPEEQVIQAGKTAELHAEKLSLSFDPNILELLEKLKKRNIIAIATSDMWLEQTWLEELLQAFNIHFDQIFTSVSTETSKNKGDIFNTIQNQLGYRPVDFLHIGDNIYNDFIQPKRAGWRSLWMPQQRHRFPPKTPSRIENMLPGTDKAWKQINLILTKRSTKKDPDNDLFRLGYEYLAPFLILFSLFQWRIFREQNIEHVFYLARDARLPLDIYDQLADTLPDSPQRHYLKISRKCIALAHPDNPLLNVLPLAGKMGRKTVGEWINNFTITPELETALLKQAGVDKNIPFAIAKDKLTAATRHQQADIEKEREKLIHCLKTHLYETAGTKQLDRIGIVDSGWAGTIQDIIQSVLPNTHLLSGLYIGVSHQGYPPTERNRKYGILRDHFRNRPYFDPWQSTAGVIRIWDTLLRTPEGTTLKLQCDDKTPMAICAANQDNPFFVKVTETIRQGVYQGIAARLDIIGALASLDHYWTLEDLERSATQFASRITTYPDRKIIHYFFNLELEEGTSQETRSYLGIRGIRQGTAWYPGIFSNSYFPVLSTLLSPYLKQRVRNI